MHDGFCLSEWLPHNTFRRDRKAFGVRKPDVQDHLERAGDPISSDAVASRRLSSAASDSMSLRENRNALFLFVLGLAIGRRRPSATQRVTVALSRSRIREASVVPMRSSMDELSCNAR